MLYYDANRFHDLFNLIECWGLDSHGKFASFHPHGKLTMMCMSREQMNNTYNVKSDLSDVIVRIQTELFKATSYTHINATASNKPLTTGNNSEVAISQKLMYLFQYDLLPPVTSRILDTKHNRDILHLTPVHALTQQCILMALLLFNAGMLGYVLYFGADARFYLQSAWARSFALYLFIDVIFTSTIFVCFFHMLLPLCISQDIYDMKTKLTTLIHQFNSNYAASRQVQPTNSTSSNSIKALPKFNASNYFFISKFIAKEYLNLHVSKFILHYATEFPRRASYQHNEENDVQTMYKLSIEAFIGFLNLPLWIQNTFIHLSCMFLIAVTIYYNVLIYEIQAEVIVISIFVYLVMIHFFYSACKSRQHMYQKAIGEKISNTENLLLMIDDVETPKPAAVLNAADALIAASATETVLGIEAPPEEEIKPVFAVYSDSEKLLTPKLKSKPKSGLLGSGSNGVDGSALEKQSSLDGIPNMQLFAKPSRDDYEGDAPTATQAASDFGIFSNTIQRMVSRQTMPSNKIVSMAESPVVTRKGVVIISPRQDDDDRFGFASKTIDIDRADELEIEIDYGEDLMEQDDDVVDRPVEDEEDDEHMHETHPMEDDAEEANTSLPTQFNYDKTQIKSFVQQARSRPVTPHERGLESKSSKAFFTDSKGVLGSRPASARPVSMNSAKADEDYNYQSDAVHDEDEEYQQIVYSQQLERSTSFERYRDEDEEFDVIAHPDQHHHHEQHHDQDNNEDDDDQSISSHAAGLHTLATEEYEPHSPTKVRDPHVLKTKGSKQRKL